MKRWKLISLTDEREWENPDAGKQLSDFRQRWLIFGCVALVVGLIDSFGPWADFEIPLVGAISRAFGLLFWPAVVAYLVSGGFRLFGRRLAPHRWMTIFTVVFALVIFSRVIIWLGIE